MIEMAAGGIGVVRHQNVAVVNTIDAVMLELGFDDVGHSTNEARKSDTDRDRLAFGGKQANGKIERLVDDHVVGGAHEVRLHFLSDCEYAVPDDFGQDRIGESHGFPASRLSIRSAGMMLH